MTFFRMLRRYGLSYFIFRWGPAEVLKRFEQIYELQGAGKSFESPEEFLEAVGLYNLTQQSLRKEIQVRRS